MCDDKVRVIGETKHGVYGRETAQKVHAEIKRVGGGINIPREFVFMDRAALGLGSVFIHLQAEINWHELFEDMIKDFDVKNKYIIQYSTYCSTLPILCEECYMFNPLKGQCYVQPFKGTVPRDRKQKN